MTALPLDQIASGANRAQARAVLDANGRLGRALAGGVAASGALDILLFLAAEDLGGGVTTSRCCGAVPVPRTTALRWIGALVSAGLVAQIEDKGDRRVTLLRLTPIASRAIGAWLDDICR